MKPVRDINSEPGLPVVRFIPLAQGEQQYEDKTGGRWTLLLWIFVRRACFDIKEDKSNLQ